MTKVNRLGTVLAISDTVHHLVVGWTTHHEGHRVRHPGLLEQARLALLHATSRNDPGHYSSKAPISGSKPPLEETLLAIIIEVEAEVAAWAGEFGIGRATPETQLRGLVGKVSELNDKDLEDLNAALAGIRRRLEVALAWKPHDRRLHRARCPQCKDQGSLRVSLDEHGPTEAHCLSCDGWWTRGQLADLADDINKEEER